MKKFISVLLAMLMIFAVSAPATGALAAQDNEYPTIYLYGANTDGIYSATGERLYPISDDVDGLNVFKQALMPCLEKLAMGLIIKDYEPYAKEFYDAFVPIFGPMALDKNGEASDGSGTEYNYATQSVPNKNSNYGQWDYRMRFDWRLSPFTAAEELKAFIERVLEATGESKVNLMGRCYGANVIATYLTEYEQHALEYVDDVAYITSSVTGLDFLGALFTGNLEIDGEFLDTFGAFYFEYLDLIEDMTIRNTVEAFLELLNEVKVMGFTGDTLNKLIDEIKYDLIPPIIRDTYGSMPSMWSMVPAEMYEEAIEFIFGDCKEEYKGLIEKTDRYYNEVQKNAYETMKNLDEKGIDFVMIAKYNIPEFPVYDGCRAQSDGLTLAWRQAFGGEYAEFGKILPESYTEANKDSKYLSPDLKIDASTCLFPETTWFIKNLYHTDFPDAISDLPLRLMNEEITVGDGVVSQFLTYDPETGDVFATEGTDEDYNKKPENPIEKLIKFLTAFFRLLTAWINGKFD